MCELANGISVTASSINCYVGLSAERDLRFLTVSSLTVCDVLYAQLIPQNASGGDVVHDVIMSTRICRSNEYVTNVVIVLLVMTSRHAVSRHTNHTADPGELMHCSCNSSALWYCR